MADETIDIRYILNSDEVASDSKKVDAAISGTQNAVELTTEDMRENIAIQKQVLKELEKQYKELEKTIKKSAPGAVRSELEGQLSGIKSDIDAEKQALVELTAVQKQYDASTRSLRTQIMELRNSMATMTEGSTDYHAAMLRLGELQDRMGDIQSQGRVFADDEKYFRTATEAVQGFAGAMSVGVGVATLFGASQENLAKIQTRLQAVMAISIGVQQVAQVLNKDSYVSHILLAGAKKMVATATTRLSIALGVSNIAAKALMATLTLGLSVAISAVVWAIDKMITSSEDAAKKQKELTEAAAKTQQQFNESVASSTAKQVLSLKKLQEEWQKLSKLDDQKKFIKDNKTAFDELGVSISGVKDAENLLVNNTDTFIASIKAKAMALAYTDLATAEYQKVIQKQLEKEQRQSTVTDDDKQSGYDNLNKQYVGKSVMGRADVSHHENKYVDEGIKASQKAAADVIQKDVDAGLKRVDDFFNASQSLFNQHVEALKKAGIKPKKDGSDKESQSKADFIKAAKEREYAIEQARIDAMQEGYLRRLAQAELNHKKELDRLHEQRDELLKIAKNSGNGNLTTKIKADFEVLESASADKAMREKLAATRQFQDDIIKDITAGAEEFQQAYGKESAAHLEYLTTYGNVAQKRYAIMVQYGDKIAAAASESEKKILRAQRGEAIKEVNSNELMNTKEWEQLFQNLDVLTSREIEALIAKINEQLKSADIDPVNFKAITDQMQQARETAARNPFAVMTAGAKAYQAALSKLETAETDKDKADAKREMKRAKQKQWQAGVSMVGDIGNSLGAVNDLLKQIGIDGGPALDGVLGSMSAIGSIDITKPFSIITGSIQAITSLVGGIFGAVDNKREAEIQHLQERIDTLTKSYELLGKAIDKAYSTDASDLIAQSNDLLEQQKKFIEQQIREEGGKKDSDDGRIAGWRKQIEEIDEKIDQNRDKSIDVKLGSDWKSDVDSFVSYFLDSFGEIGNGAKDFAKQMQKNIITELLKKDIGKAVEDMRKQVDGLLADGDLSEADIADIDKMSEEIGRVMEERGKMYDKILKDDNKAQNENSLAGQIRGSVATEASVAELGGLFRSQTDSLLRIDSKLDLGFGQISELARSNAAIEANTLATATNTAQTVTTLANGFTAMHAELTAINKNTSKDTGSYGG